MAGELIPIDYVYEFGLPFGNNKRSGRNFSFRNCDSGAWTISILPGSFDGAIVDFQKKDASIKNILGDEFGYDEIVDSIPRVRAREYLLVPLLNNICNAFQAFVQGIDQGLQAADKTKLKDLGDKLGRALKEIQSDPERILKIFKGALDTFEEFGMVTALKTEDKMFTHIPFVLYYGIVQTMTMNRYTIPYTDKTIDKADGSPGWSGLLDSMFSATKSFSSLVNINAETMPVWRSGNNKDSQQFQIQFDLFNSTLKSAIDNYLFVNTIVPMNKYLQYHFLQNGPAVYDLQIDGVGRFFMCSATVDVKYKGIMRSPPKGFKDEIFKEMSISYKDAYIDPQASQFDEGIEEYRKTLDIRIPDVYTVTITFKSLLPNSLNNHIYRYALRDIDSSEFQIPKNIVEKIANGFNDVVKEVVGG